MGLVKPLETLFMEAGWKKEDMGRFDLKALAKEVSEEVYPVVATMEDLKTVGVTIDTPAEYAEEKASETYEDDTYIGIVVGKYLFDAETGKSYGSI